MTARSRFQGTARPGRRRDRRGRGVRGPLALPGPLAPGGIPVQLSPNEAFDRAVLEVVARLEKRFATELERIEFAVEDHPLLPAGWDQPVPLATAAETEEVPPGLRIVLFRRPIASRVDDRTQLGPTVWAVVVDQLAAVWDMDPHDIDPRW